MNYLSMQDSISKYYMTFYRNMDNIDLPTNNTNIPKHYYLHSTFSPVMPVKVLRGYMRAGYSYEEGKMSCVFNWARQNEATQNMFEGVRIAQSASALLSLFYLNQTAKVEYIKPIANRRNNIFINIVLPVNVKQDINTISSSHVGNITMIRFDGVGGAYEWYALRLVLPPYHAAIYFWSSIQIIQNLYEITDLPDSYTIFVYWW